MTNFVREENDKLRVAPFTAFSETSWNRVRFVGRLREDQAAQIAVMVEASRFVFDDEAEPNGNHEKATFTVNGVECCFWIEYYDRDMTRRSERPGSSFETRRMITYSYVGDSA